MKKKTKNKFHEPQSKQSMRAESSRIQTKLQSLKEQIQLKKKQKQQIKKSTVEEQVSKFLLTNQPAQTELPILLHKLKAEQYLQNIHDKNIHSLQQLLNTPPQQLDEWKDIPIGYRIKLKKVIIEHNQPPEPQIQTIIKERAEKRKFVPIAYEQEEQEQQQVQRSDDEDVLIQSLNEAFNPRKSIIRQPSAELKTNNKHVHWDSSVQEHNRQATNFKGQMLGLPKPQTPKQDRNYCWNCLKKITNPYQLEGRLFCCEGCMNAYQERLLPEDYELDLSVL